MPAARLLTISVSLILVLSGCTSGSSTPAPPTQAPFRPFTSGDAALLNIDKTTANNVVATGQTKVATQDFRLQPDCHSQLTFILATATARWLGGDPGCMVVRLSLPGQAAPMAINPFCHLDSVLTTHCLQLDYTPAPIDEMMAQLRPAAQVEVLMSLSPDPDMARFMLPTALKQPWFVVQPNANQDFRLAPLYGSKALNIIVPSDIKLAGGRFGHNQLYIFGPHRFTDPLCHAVKHHGLAALPIAFSGTELANLQLCERQ